MTDVVIIQRLLLITLIAGAIGYDRERHGRAAGFRTHILVGVGACLVMLTGLYLSEQLAGRASFDPTRMAAQVISGIGFLGAGTILRSRASIKGLTTAASLWAVGGVGLAVGAGFLHGAIATGVIVILVLLTFARVERVIRRGWYQTLIIETGGGAHELAQIRQLLSTFRMEIQDVDVVEGEQPNQTRLEFQVKLFPDQPREDITRQLLQLGYVTAARWE